MSKVHSFFLWSTNYLTALMQWAPLIRSPPTNLKKREKIICVYTLSSTSNNDWYAAGDASCTLLQKNCQNTVCASLSRLQSFQTGALNKLHRKYILTFLSKCFQCTRMSLPTVFLKYRYWSHFTALFIRHFVFSAMFNNNWMCYIFSNQ